MRVKNGQTRKENMVEKYSVQNSGQKVGDQLLVYPNNKLIPQLLSISYMFCEVLNSQLKLFLCVKTRDPGTIGNENAECWKLKGLPEDLRSSAHFPEAGNPAKLRTEVS